MKGPYGRARRLFVSALGALILVALAPATASAEINGNCRASINNTDVATVDSGIWDKSKAIVVQAGGQATVALDSPTPISDLLIYLEAGGQRIPVINRPVNGTTVRETVPVDQYRQHVVGLLKVIGEGRGAGQTCSGAAMLFVDGDPLGTSLGLGSLGASVLGGLGVVGAGVAALQHGGRRLHVSGVGLLGGLVLGLGGLLLAQQYGVAYSTLPLTLGSVVGGALGGGVVLPSLLGAARG